MRVCCFDDLGQFSELRVLLRAALQRGESAVVVPQVVRGHRVLLESLQERGGTK